jgi:hypothetical protein
MMMISFSTKQGTNIMKDLGQMTKNHWIDEALDKQLMTSGCGGCYVTQTIHVVFGTP